MNYHLMLADIENALLGYHMFGPFREIWNQIICFEEKFHKIQKKNHIYVHMAVALGRKVVRILILVYDPDYLD